MKNLKTIIGLAAMALCLGFASCSSDDDAPSYSTAAVSNSKLMTILKDKGYQFNEQGNLLLDDKATSTTSLDLSGTKISQKALAELNILPNLTDVNLSNNGYEDSFDFSNLPAQVTGIDLTGNEIKDYDNLIKVTVAENGDETIENLHNITKLYLPNEAKNNISQLVRFYRQNKNAIDNGTMDVKMSNAKGMLDKFNTLREVPNEKLRNYLCQETAFSDLFDGEKINLEKHLSMNQKTNNIIIDESLSDISSLEGIQYIINNPTWEGTTITIKNNEKVSLPQIEIPSTITYLTLVNTDSNFNLSNAKALYFIDLEGISDLDVLDLTNTAYALRESSIERDDLSGSKLIIYDCENLTSIVLPKDKDLYTNTFDIECLPNLKQINWENFKMICHMSIGDLSDNYQLSYPNLTDFMGGPRKNKTYFACSQSTFERASTKEFIDKFYNSSSPKKLATTTLLGCSKNQGVSWWK